MNNDYKGTQYPKQVYKAVRDQTFAVNSELFLARAEDGDNPLEVYNGFSRFVFAIITKTKTSVTANVPVSEIAGIMSASQFARKADLEARYISAPTSAASSASVQAEASAAFSVRIANGNLRGRTPAEVILEENGEEKLERQKAWLLGNLEKYPKNQEQIGAIDQALTLKRNGGFTKQAESRPSGPGRPIVLYEAMYRPLIRRRNASGNSFVYDIRISWCIGQEYPVSIQIQNYYAPVIKDERTGLLNVKASQAEDKTSTEMLLLAKEWEDCLRAVRANMFQFEVLHARDCIRDAEEAVAWNMQHSKEGR